MDAADEITTEHEDDLGGESSEEMAEPHVRYAPYAPIAGDQAIVSLHDFALSAQRQDETQRGNNPTMPSPEAKPPRHSYETSQKASQDSVDEGEQRDFQVETSVEAADIKPLAVQLELPSDSPIILPVLQSDTTIASAEDASQMRNETEEYAVPTGGSEVVDRVTRNQEDDTANVEGSAVGVLSESHATGGQAAKRSALEGRLDLEEHQGDKDEDENKSADESVVDAVEQTKETSMQRTNSQGRKYCRYSGTPKRYFGRNQRTNQSADESVTVGKGPRGA
jgi:hypothetical protein